LDQVVVQVKNAAENAKKIGINLFNKVQQKIRDLNTGEESTFSEPSPIFTQSGTPTSSQKAPATSRAGYLFNKLSQTPAQGILATQERSAPPLPHSSRYAKTTSEFAI